MDKFKKIGLSIFSICVVLFLFGLSIGTVFTCPDNALLLIDEGRGEYFAPPCLMHTEYNKSEKIFEFAQKNNLKVLQRKEILRKNLNPNVECREENGFIEDGRSISGRLLEKIGILPKFESRWNSDGTWNK